MDAKCSAIKLVFTQSHIQCFLMTKHSRNDGGDMAVMCATTDISICCAVVTQRLQFLGKSVFYASLGYVFKVHVLGNFINKSFTSSGLPT